MRYLLLSLVLSGCAGAIQIGAPAPDAEPTVIGSGEMPTNEILITRPSEIGIVTSVVTRPVLFLEAREIGRCQVGKPLRLSLPDGTWRITAMTDGGEVTREVTTTGNDRIAMTCGVTGAVDPAPILVINPV